MKNRLILVDAILNDRSLEFAKAIHNAGEFEWCFGIKETPERLKTLKINKKGYYNILDTNDNFIGYVGVNYEDPEPEIELYIIKKYRRKGYAKEALFMMLTKVFYEDFGDTEIKKLTSSVRKENVPSQKLMETCGFEQNKDIGFCMLMFFSEESNNPMNQPIELVHYYITREMFIKRSNI